VIAALRAASQVLIPVTFAAFLTVLLAPVLRSLKRLHVPTFLGIPLTVLSCVAVLLLLFTVVGQSVNALVATAPRYQERFVSLTHGAIAWLSAHGIEVSQQKLISSLRSDRALSLLGQALSELATLLSHVMLILLLVLFLLVDTVDLPQRMKATFGGARVEILRLYRIAEEVKQYLVLKTYLCLLTGFVVWVVLTVTGIDFAPLWALLSVLLGYVPNIGPFIASAPPVVLALLQVGPGRMVIVLAMLSTVHMVIGNLLEPHVLGRRLGLSAFSVFVALIVWGWIWGAAGMLLSVPLMVVIKILLENSPRYGFLAQLLEPATTKRLSQSPPPPENAEAGPKA
jgi:predicted PurR-regulated permease PerM